MKMLSDQLPASIPFGPIVNTERHGGSLAARVFKEHGVEFIFCLAGGHISPILVAAKQAGIRIIDVRHEVNFPLIVRDLTHAPLPNYECLSVVSVFVCWCVR
jgi:hypothetical protein